MQPRTTASTHPSARLGEVLFSDIKPVLEARGFLVNAGWQRFLDFSPGQWCRIMWETSHVSIWGSHKVIFIRMMGLHSTPPDHVAELFADEIEV